jgi:LPS-assembly protein
MNNAWLEIYNQPVLYFPKFFHPDPTVERQSGFLIPSIISSNTAGNSFRSSIFSCYF